MDTFNCYLGGNVEPDLVTGHPPWYWPPRVFFAHLTYKETAELNLT